MCHSAEVGWRLVKISAQLTRLLELGMQHLCSNSNRWLLHFDALKEIQWSPEGGIEMLSLTPGHKRVHASQLPWVRAVIL